MNTLKNLFAAAVVGLSTIGQMQAQSSFIVLAAVTLLHLVREGRRRLTRRVRRVPPQADR